MDNEHALMLIEHYIDDYLEVPDIRCTDNRFGVYTYSRWAAYELFERIANEAMILPVHISGREQESPVDIIKDFIRDMEYCSTIKIENSYIFDIAKDTAEDILKLIFTERRNNA